MCKVDPYHSSHAWLLSLLTGQLADPRALSTALLRLEDDLGVLGVPLNAVLLVLLVHEDLGLPVVRDAADGLLWLVGEAERLGALGLLGVSPEELQVGQKRNIKGNKWQLFLISY